MTQLTRLNLLLLSILLAVPALAAPTEQAPGRAGSAELPAAPAAVPALPGSSLEIPAAGASVLDAYGALPSAAARDAAAAAAVQKAQAGGLGAAAGVPAAVPAAGSDEAALQALPQPLQTRFKEADAAFEQRSPEAIPETPGPAAASAAATPLAAATAKPAAKPEPAVEGRRGALSTLKNAFDFRRDPSMALLRVVQVVALPVLVILLAGVGEYYKATLLAIVFGAGFVGQVLHDPAPAGPQRSTQAPIYQTIDGVQRPLSYNPALVRPPLWKETLVYAAHPIKRVKQVVQYVRRVNQYMAELTDADLGWSMKRFPEFEKQEGILRHSNRALVNDWKQWSGGSLPKVSPADYNDALMSRVSIRKIFKQAMDREEPTLSYQATSAHELHDFMHNVAHFMGITMQERVISIALTGNPPQESVWAAEEKRHGNIMERVYNFSRPQGWPELNEQGIAPTSPSRGAHSMIANRALAEIGAGTGYLVLKSNAKKGSPADLALEGIFRDEVYHYVLMDAARKWGFGHPAPLHERVWGLTRWTAQMIARAVMDLPGLRRLGVKVQVKQLNQYWGLERLLNIVQHYNDNQLPLAVDTVIDERGGFSPLAVFQVAYAFASIHNRVTKYLNTIPDEQGNRAIGQVYKTQAEFDAAVAEGKHTRTETFSVEQNPDLTADEVRELARRFPGRFQFERRSIKASQIRDILANYRELLKSQSYWQRKKGFARGKDRVYYNVSTNRIVDVGLAAANVLERRYPDGKVVVAFPTQPSKDAQPEVTVLDAAGNTLLRKPVSDLSMRQLGVIFADDAPAEAKKGVEPLSKINELGPDYTPAEINARLGAKQTYRAEPLQLIED